MAVTVVRLAAIAVLALLVAAVAAPARPEAAAREGPVLDCRDRITGAFTIVDGVQRPYRFRVRPRHDRRIGPIAFAGAKDYGAPGVWEQMVRDEQWLKSPALVRRGATVTLEIPRSQRGWMRIRYGGGGTGAVTLRACRRPATRAECGPGPRTTCRTRVTPYSGGFEIDFARAPLQGRCAELIVRAGAKVRRERLYPGACGAAPR